MSENENSDHIVIDRQNGKYTTTKRSGKVVILPEIMKYYRTVGAILDSYEQAVALMSDEENFYSQMKELN